MPKSSRRSIFWFPASEHDPLFITHYTLASALGHGKAATLSALQEERSGLAPMISPTPRWTLSSAAWRALKKLPCHQSAGRIRLPQQPPGATVPGTGRLCRRRGCCARKAWRQAHRGDPGHQHFRHSRNRACLPPPRSGQRRVCPATSIMPQRKACIPQPNSCAATWISAARPLSFPPPAPPAPRSSPAPAA